MNISTMAIGNPPSKKERLHLNAFKCKLQGIWKVEWYASETNVTWVSPSRSNFDRCLPSGRFRFQNLAIVKNYKNAQMYGEMLIDLPLKLHCLGWCHMFMNLLFAIYLSISYTLSKIYHLKRYYFQSSPSKKTEKKHRKMPHPPLLPIKRPSIIWEFSPFLLSEGLSIGRAAHVCLGSEISVQRKNVKIAKSIQWFHPKNTWAMI